MELSVLVAAALAEDLPAGDLTSQTFVAQSSIGHGFIAVREAAVISGLSAVFEVFRQVDTHIELTALTSDGATVIPGQRIVELRGPARSLLAAERTALNFLGYLSGVATQTRSFVEKTGGTRAKILGTRKMLPGFRALAAEAIRHGGGDIYRVNLSAAVLLKDNHLANVGGMNVARDSLAQLNAADPGATRRLLENGKIEVDDFAQLEQAVQMGWKQILLDNFTVADVRRAVERYGERASLEASGGINLSNVADYAATGVHYISCGALTHSVRTIDFGLELSWTRN
jgi:nicotinate-nucleotide pyrophosphorylase (carboxylating)